MYLSPATTGLLGLLTVAITSTAPAEWAGESIVHSVVDVQFTEVAFALPNLNVVLPTRKFRPLTVTLAPPAAVPVFGVTLLTVGGGVNVNLSALTATLWPAALVSVMSTTPGEDAGDSAFSDVAEVTVKLAAGVLPNFTAVTSGALKFRPVIVTDVPPVWGPVTVDSFLTTGGSALRCTQVSVSLLRSASASQDSAPVRPVSPITGECPKEASAGKPR